MQSCKDAAVGSKPQVMYPFQKCCISSENEIGLEYLEIQIRTPLLPGYVDHTTAVGHTLSSDIPAAVNL